MNRRRGQIIILLICLQFALSSLFLLKSSISFSSYRNKSVDQISKLQSLPKIYDRNCNLIATNVPTASVYASPKKIENPEKFANHLKGVLLDLDYEAIKKKLSSEKDFVWIKRQISPKQHFELLYKGLPGVYITSDIKRAYIGQNLFSHVLGYVNIDNEGIAGLEHYIARKKIKKDLKLTLDLSLIHI